MTFETKMLVCKARMLSVDYPRQLSSSIDDKSWSTVNENDDASFIDTFFDNRTTCFKFFSAFFFYRQQNQSLHKTAQN